MNPLLRLLAGLAVAAVLTAAMWLLPRLLAPNLYQSVARLRLDPPGWSGGQQGAAEFDERHLATELEIIRSETTLRGVLNDLGLAAIWSAREGREFTPEEAGARLRERVAVRAVPNTMLVEIHAASPEAAEAACIANAVAETYLRHQEDRRTGRAAGRLQTLRQEVEIAETEVTEAKAALVRLREQVLLASAPTVALKIEEDLARERFDRARLRVQSVLGQLHDYERGIGIPFGHTPVLIIDAALPSNSPRPWHGGR